MRRHLWTKLGISWEKAEGRISRHVLSLVSGFFDSGAVALHLSSDRNGHVRQSCYFNWRHPKRYEVEHWDPYVLVNEMILDSSSVRLVPLVIPADLLVQRGHSSFVYVCFSCFHFQGPGFVHYPSICQSRCSLYQATLLSNTMSKLVFRFLI